jgi:3',5'-cyclic AMP phosphodiesterase CpdA
MNKFLKIKLLIISIVFVLSLNLSAQEEIQFIYTSDPHYGITRSKFQGNEKVDAVIVNQAMIAKINSMLGITLPNDGGLRSGQPVNYIDFLVETGDIANRSEGSGDKAIQSAEKSWKQFKADYIDGLTVTDKASKKAQVFIVPGNHDVTNAVGFYKTMTPEKDATAMAEIYNLMHNPKTPKTKDNYNYSTDRINYSKDISGIHFIFITMWPDSIERKWIEADLKKVDKTTPVIIFTHDQPDAESKHFTNPNGSHDINSKDQFENLLSDELKDGKAVSSPSTLEQQDLDNLIKKYPNITAYFHGNSNWNQYYDWTGPDNKIALHTIRVDSPMKGEISAKDEKKLSFQLITIDPKARTMTVRECLWNADPSNPKAAIVFGSSETIALFPRP